MPSASAVSSDPLTLGAEVLHYGEVATAH